MVNNFGFLECCSILRENFMRAQPEERVGSKEQAQPHTDSVKLCHDALDLLSGRKIRLLGSPVTPCYNNNK